MSAPVRMRLADHIAKELRARGHTDAMHGDGILVDAAGDHVRLKNPHPLNVMKAALDAMERAPDLFSKTMVHAHDGHGRPCVVRCFHLRKRRRAQ